MSATFSPSNSSIHSWLSFDGTTLPTLPTCQYNNSVVSCSQACNDSVSLFSDSSSQSNSLVTCGLWTSLVMASTDVAANGTLGPTNSTNASSDLLTPFQPLNLNASDYQNASVYADIISNCLQDIYQNVKQFTFAADDGITLAACTRHELFPVGPGNNSLNDCLQGICSPLTLNPDLAGIGVGSAVLVEVVDRDVLTRIRYSPPSWYSHVSPLLHLLLCSSSSCALQGDGHPTKGRPSRTQVGSL